MFIKEKEVKILNINEQEIRKKLENLECEYVEENLQQYYVYNFHPFFSEIKKIISIINNPIIENKYKNDYRNNLKKIMWELFGLITEDEIKQIIKYFKCYSVKELSSKILTDNEIIIEDEDEFYMFISKYTFNSNKWIRLRKTGNKTTLTIKQIKRTNNQYDIDNVDELEFEVSDFEKCNFALKELGYNFKAYQEKKRITYTYKNKISFEIDSWPMIPIYLEIESNDIELINEWTIKLGIRKEDIKIMNTDDVYLMYGINIYEYKKLCFDNPIKFL